MADMALEVTVAANMQRKRDARRYDRDYRSGVSRGYGGGYGGGGYRGGYVGKQRDDRGGYRERAEEADESAKVLISNLGFEVSDEDVRELFAEFGPTRRMRLNYDRSGRSVGTAEVIYLKRADAYRAMQQYNGVPLDGKPMIIEIVSSNRDANRPPPPRQYSRPVPYGSRNFEARQSSNDHRRNRSDHIEKTAEELDRELDQYLQSAGKENPSTESEALNDSKPEEKSTEEPAPVVTEEEEKDILDGED